MKRLQEAQRAFTKNSSIQQYFSVLSIKIQRYKFGRFISLMMLMLILPQAQTVAQEQPWSQQKVNELTAKAYKGDLESFDALARHYLILGIENNEVTTYGDNFKAGLAITKGMRARWKEKLIVAHINYWNGRYYFQSRDYVYAFKLLDRSTLKRHQGNAYAHLLLGKILDEGLGREEQNFGALMHYEKATESEGVSRQAYFMMGRVYLDELKDAKKAQSALQVSVEQGFKKAEELLEIATKQVEEKNAILEGNPVLAAETNYYDNVLQKTTQANATLDRFFVELEALKNEYDEMAKRQKQSLLDFRKDRQDIAKPKTEFETREQFNTRITEYRNLEETHKKAYEDSITSLLNAFSPYKNESYSEKSFFYGELSSTRKLKKKYEGYLKFAHKYPAELKSLETSHISTMVYNAETEFFTLSYRSWEDRSNKEYRVSVPRTEAQAFKEQKEQNQYYFFLDEPRAILAQGKTYQIITNDSWHSKINCVGFNPTLTSDDAFRRKYFDFNDATDALVNGKPFDAAVFQKTVQENQALKDYFTEASKNKKLSGRKTWKARVTLTYSDKESRKFGETEVSPSLDIRFLDPNYLNDELDAVLRGFYSPLYESIKDIEVKLPTKNCQTFDTAFEFEVSFIIGQ